MNVVPSRGPFGSSYLRLLGPVLDVPGRDLGTHGTNGSLGRKPLVLLARLLLDTRPLTREAAMAFLWPAASEERARGSLRQALHALRHALSPECLRITRLTISMESPPVADVTSFLAAVRNGEHVQAVRLYGGPLLQDVSLTDASDAELWVTIERRRLEHLYCAAAETLVRDGAAPADERLRVAARLVESTPHALRVWRMLLRVQQEVGALIDYRLSRASFLARVAAQEIDDHDGAALLSQELINANIA